MLFCLFSFRECLCRWLVSVCIRLCVCGLVSRCLISFVRV